MKKNKRELDEAYRECMAQFGNVFDSIEAYALEIENFVANNGKEHLTDVHIMNYHKVRTYIGWRNDLAVKRKLQKAAKKIAKRSVKEGKSVAEVRKDMQGDDVPDVKGYRTPDSVDEFFASKQTDTADAGSEG